MQQQVKKGIPGYELCGERARLIPVVADSHKEQKAVSVTLACIHAVEEFGKSLLNSVGAPARKTSRVDCYTEVTSSRSQVGSRNFRPDGLIVIRTGNRQWAAIIEAKIGNAKLDEKQILEYIDLARAHGVEAIITISNDFAPRPTHHPVDIKKNKLGKMELYHWSWTYLMTQAILQVRNDHIADSDQAYMLAELIRFLRHDHSGVSGMDKMPSSWPELCNTVRQGLPLTRTIPGVGDAVSAWHELTRFISLEFSVRIGRTVTISLPSKYTNAPQIHEADDIANLCDKHTLEGIYDVPDAAARVHISLNLRTRTALAWMELKAPRDRTQPRSCVTWIVNQLRKVESPDAVHIHARFLGKTPNQPACLLTLQNDKDAILRNVPGKMPTSFIVRHEVDLAGDLTRSKKCVQRLVDLALGFYSNAGQHLRTWVPKPPQTQPNDKSRLNDEDEPIVAGTDSPCTALIPLGILDL